MVYTTYGNRTERSPLFGIEKVAQDPARPFDTRVGSDNEPPLSYQLPDDAPPPWQPKGVPQKDVTLATVLAIIPGLGHVYTRKYVQGLAIFFIVVAMFALYFLIIPPIIGLFVWAWQILDANKTAKEYNKRLVETGVRPW